MRHSIELRAAVVAALLGGATVNGAARQYGVSRGTITLWRRLAFQGVTTAVTPVPPSHANPAQQETNTGQRPTFPSDNVVTATAEAAADHGSPHDNWTPPTRRADWREEFESYVKEILYAMRVQVAWLTRQSVLERTPYASINVAHGDFADRVARIAQSLGAVESPAWSAEQPRLRQADDDADDERNGAA